MTSAGLLNGALREDIASYPSLSRHHPEQWAQKHARKNAWSNGMTTKYGVIFFCVREIYERVSCHIQQECHSARAHLVDHRA
jgi:hypothetical protein